MKYLLGWVVGFDSKDQGEFLTIKNDLCGGIGVNNKPTIYKSRTKALKKAKRFELQDRLQAWTPKGVRKIKNWFIREYWIEGGEGQGRAELRKNPAKIFLT